MKEKRKYQIDLPNGEKTYRWAYSHYQAIYFAREIAKKKNLDIFRVKITLINGRANNDRINNNKNDT